MKTQHSTAVGNIVITDRVVMDGEAVLIHVDVRPGNLFGYVLPSDADFECSTGIMFIDGNGELSWDTPLTCTANGAFAATTIMAEVDAAIAEAFNGAHRVLGPDGTLAEFIAGEEAKMEAVVAFAESAQKLALSLRANQAEVADDLRQNLAGWQQANPF